MAANDELRLAFGESLRFWRQKKGLSQEQLAEEAGTSTSFIGMLERGERGTSLEQIGNLADALSIEVRDLFTSEEIPELYRQAELLVRKILSRANESQIKFFVAFCEIFDRQISGRQK